MFRLLKFLAVALMMTSLLACVSRDGSTVALSEGEGWASIKQCVNDTFERTKPNIVTNALISEATQVCYSHLHGQGLLNDFKLRRLKFIQQSYDERVLLWMVVVITLSGVALAGVQMMASYKLASGGIGNFEQTGELSIEQSKLSLKSSVTGLFILICSFAFFWVFVYEIFVIKEIDPDQQSKNVTKQEMQAKQTGPFIPKVESLPVPMPPAEK
jgi:hypothetical protein